MTKEELKNLLFEAACKSSPAKVRSILDEFFSQNVVVPRGENRHPYADVLHEWVEGEDIQVFDNHPYSNCFMPLKGMNINSEIPEDLYIKLLTNELRIKPPEPVYEWQWYDVEHVLDASGVSTKRVRILNNGEYMTENEADSCTRYGLIYRFEETKRERK